MKMEEYPQLLNRNARNNEWLVNYEVSEDTKLELRLGPPGEFLGYNNNTTPGSKRAFQHTRESQHSKASFFQNLPISKKPAVAGMAGDFSPSCRSRMAEVQFPDRKASSTSLDTANKRTANPAVVGWPPIRSLRKNLASNSLSNLASGLSNEMHTNGGKPGNPKAQLFVKINMEGIPIGRKVNLRFYDSYEELSLAIDQLFSGLLSAQSDSSATQNENKIEELANADAGSLAGSGEYTLVYEDDEGDRMLVGDVPWHMFISTAKRLHVMKSSELSTLQTDIL